MIVDSHIHLWGDAVARADWLAAPRTEPIRRRFTLADYAAAVTGTEIGSAVVVTAERSVRETARLIEECRDSALVAGVVGWLDPHQPSEDIADQLLGVRLLPGVDIGRFARTGLVLELLVSASDLPAVTRCADEHPNTTIVVDHLGNPPADPAAWQTWRQDIWHLGSRDNVRMKFSGDGLTEKSAEVALAALGTTRLMFGSDWPVSLLRASLDTELAASRQFTSSLSDHERDQLFAATAIETYGL